MAIAAAARIPAAARAAACFVLAFFMVFYLRVGARRTLGLTGMVGHADGPQLLRAVDADTNANVARRLQRPCRIRLENLERVHPHGRR